MDRKNGAEKIFEEIIAKDFPNLILKKNKFLHTKWKVNTEQNKYLAAYADRSPYDTQTVKSQR